jgi:hypothetical protein
VRNPDAIAHANTMVMLGQPIMLSLLPIVDGGRLQGYRIFTDTACRARLAEGRFI